ncbi:unnamed protein product [Schistocephalus solidus]|uniref:ANF_receptor domain-containing protein n=1 Tax=Schistocephalus solidus TaxID=70667 RepID=A0A183SFR8_SCHSO|nr:unnamed protein product [Schistocephalus solidus]
MMRTLNAIWWIYTLNFAMVLTETKLELFVADINESCWPEGMVYGVFDTIWSAIDYATLHTNGQLETKDVQIRLNYIDGCSMVEGQQIYSIVNFLKVARMQANSTICYSVFVGPRLGSNCNFISDWIALGADSTEAYRNLYQISYSCQEAQSVRHSATFFANPITAQADITSFVVNLKDLTISRALNIFLRQKGWTNIVVLYETNAAVLQYRELAKNLEFYLSREPPDIEPLNVIAVHNLQLNIDPRGTVRRFCTPCQAIILLTRPSLSYYFIDVVSNMSIFENSETAIIQVDPSNAITYDVLRLWRHILSQQGALGTAAQCIFLMTALPVGQGFDISSEILQTKIQVSLASAVALAVRLTYANYVRSGGVPPANTSFFAPLNEGFFMVPVLPNLTYRFSSYDGDLVELYDFYFLTFTPAISAGTTNISALNFEEIFEVYGVLLNPKQTFTAVNSKVGPNPNRHPQRDYCLLSSCFKGITTLIKNGTVTFFKGNMTIGGSQIYNSD